ncbi:GNAT family N-acetyltransferase [Pseudalkalibacillus decolorationis]|uniref:GNAT family N-acetyltransferase n=1 Tax=Pseudalkalibacillus decolorationis TaxID=163879 RepID=UPI002147FC46|nr:GNAT family N-acetyltransferase [Pseudalkalibacillus decolorationis]
MNQATEQIKIVEYDPSYAAAVAEMWNNSQDGWGGGNTVQTAEQVIKQEANSTNLHLFLALDGEKVVGYCSLGEYREDEGALYIPLLNVRGDYHGKKVGKKLVLTALERAIDMKWPRLDLYTWPGNTKAVPLYKKCGFFWEERDDATHLMNFMPTVLHTEAVQDFFKDLNWYEASTRVIEVKPDGSKDNDYRDYEYSWSNEERMLKMQFERFGRGLRLIETDDYYISATIEDFKLVFGSEYKILYSLKNKTGKPLRVSLKGEDNKNIQFSLDKDSVEVKDEVTIEAPFYVDRIEEEQSIWRTHPTVNTMLTINGKDALFKVGLLPKFPANVTCHTPGNLSYIGSSTTLFVDIENNYKETITFSFSLPESDLLELESNNIEVTLEPKSRCSIPVPFTLKQHGFYSPEVTITATKQDGSAVTYSKKIGVAFKGIGAKFSGECEETYHVYNGQYHLWLQKFDNWLVPGKTKTEDQDSAFMYPKLGKPFSEEFSKVRAEKVEFIEDASSIGYRATYQSKAFPDVKLHAVAKLYSEGLIEHHYEVENTQINTLQEDIWLNNPIYHTLERAVIPYENKIVEMKDSIGSFHEYWKGDSVTENWIFSRDNLTPRGICWSKDEKINFGGWFVYFENHIGRLQGKEIVKTKPVYMTIGAFQDWDSFREFSMQQTVEQKALTEHLEFVVNNHNPFISGYTIPVSVIDYKAAYFNGTIYILLGDKVLNSKQFKTEDAVKTGDFDVNVDNAENIGVLSSKLKLDSIETKKESLFVRKGSNPIRYKSLLDKGLETLSCSNGLLEISVAPDFYPSLYSLKANGREWLDSSFPKVQPKSWWNPWPGGVQSTVREVSPNSILKEKRHAEFVTLNDTKGNKWEGLKVVVKLDEHEKYKGFEYHQYFLLLAGSSVLCQTTEIIQNANRYIHMKKWDTNCFFRPSQDIANGWGSFQNTNGDWHKIHGGKGEQQIIVGRNVVFGSEDHDDQLQVITDLNDTELNSYINKEIMMFGIHSTLNIDHGKRFFTTPVFFMLNKEWVPDSALSSLKSIRF